MRLIFLGSGEFGLPTLRRLHEHHPIVAVVSQPDRPAGRRRQDTPTPIAAWAQTAGIALLKPLDVNAPDVVSRIDALKPDGAVIIAFGQKLGDSLIAGLGGLAVNLHASLLPRLRGAAPINWAILNGEHETGVSVISLAQRMDAGLIYAQQATPIDPRETAGELHDRLAQLGPPLIESVLAQWKEGKLEGRPQDEAHATRAPKLSKADGRISFDMTALQFRRTVHGLTPWPGVQVLWHRGGQPDHQHDTPLILLRVEDEPDMTLGTTPGLVIDPDRVAVRDGSIRLLEVQVPGRRPMAIADFLRGHPMTPGDILLSQEQRDAAID